MNSKFHALAFPMHADSELSGLLETCRLRYPNATHYCYAWRLGPDGSLAHSSDDGEPANSAGAPIARQLVSAELYDVLVVVVRYYGGKKLGVGGLISAYGDAAKDVLDQADMVEVKPILLLELRDVSNRDYKIYEFANRYQLTIIQTGRPFVLQTDAEQREFLESVLKELPNFEWHFIEKLGQ